MARTVTTIPATISRFSSEQINTKKKRKVCAYARVSTDSEEQQTSYDAQIDYYTNYIKSRKDWEFVKMYSDEGISGTNTKHRTGFKNMILDALDGKIDLIITKSVSRFARNTVDSLTTIRKLKENGIECYFEKENIWTFDGKGELLLTIMSSLAQEESRSISENVTWGRRKTFADGKVSVPYSIFLGYDKGEDGRLVINQEQAITVRKIYKLFLQGLTAHSIANRLTQEGVLSSTNSTKWNSTTVSRILSNEKYKGDALLQKKYTVDFLTKKQKVNRGEIQQYYVENNHEPIISKELFEMVQIEARRRREVVGKYCGNNIISAKIRCGECGYLYGSKVWHSTDKYRKVVYRCNNKYKEDYKCKTPSISEKELKEIFIIACNTLFNNNTREINSYLNYTQEVIENLDFLVLKLSNNKDNKNKKEEIHNELIELNNDINSIVLKAGDLECNQNRYKKLIKEYDYKSDIFRELNEKIHENEERKKSLNSFINSLKNQGGIFKEFNDALWAGLVGEVYIFSDEKIIFKFKGGIDININRLGIS